MARADNENVVYRSCNLCEAHCGVAIHTDSETGEVTGIRGDENDAMSRGYVCPKAVGLGALATDPDRIRTPLRRVRGGSGGGTRDEFVAALRRAHSAARPTLIDIPEQLALQWW